MTDMSGTLVDDMCGGLSKERKFNPILCFKSREINEMNGWIDGGV